MQSSYEKIVFEGDVQNPQCHEHPFKSCPSALDYCMQIKTKDYCHRNEHRSHLSDSAATSMILLFQYYLPNHQLERVISSYKANTKTVGFKRNTSATTDYPSVTRESAIGAIVDNDGRSGDEGDQERTVMDTGSVEVAILPQKEEEEDKGSVKKQRKCLVTRCQRVSNWISLMPLLFLLLFVTTSALPPVIRIGKLTGFLIVQLHWLLRL